MKFGKLLTKYLAMRRDLNFDSYGYEILSNYASLVK